MSEVIKSISQNFSHRLGNYAFLFNLELISIFTLWLFTISSLIGISLGYLDWFINKTPLNLMIGFLLLLINVPLGKKYGKQIFLITFLFGMILEIVGVVRGDVFGVYHYGNNLGFKVYGVPLMIGIYWAVLTTITYQMARAIFSNIILIALTGATLMVGLDLLMEQMAHTFDFWHFTGGLAPLQNYYAWFLAAFLLQILVYLFYPKGGTRFSVHLYLNQIVFFVATYLILSL